MLNSYLQTLFSAMTPVGELRLAIPLALGKLGLGWPEAYFLSVLGNLIPVVFLLLFLEKASVWLSRHSHLFHKFFQWLFTRTRNRISGRYQTYGYLALVIFVAIPLPLTGAWSGAAAAYLLGIPFGRAFGLIALGVAMAGVVVTVASVGVISLF